MAELARLGAAAFTDDGRPVVSAGLMQRALQYSAVTGRLLALHEEEPTLSRDGQMHEGAVSAELGLAGWPSVAESVMIERDCALAAYEQRAFAYNACLGAGIRGCGPGRAGARGRRQRGGLAAPPLPHRRRRAHPRHQPQDEPAAALGGRPAGAPRGAARRHDRLHRDRSRAARAAREGRAVRGGAVRRHRPRDGVRGALHVSRRAGRRSTLDARAGADVGRPGADLRAARCRGSR